VKYIDEFRDGVVARQLAAAIAGEVRSDRRYHLMEFCGGHTHAISRYGIKDLLPVNVRMIHGPGCPVCVLPIGRIDNAIELAERPWTILATYADTMRVPASKGLSLQKAKARGADIRMVYSSADALRIARENPERLRRSSAGIRIGGRRGYAQRPTERRARGKRRSSTRTERSATHQPRPARRNGQQPTSGAQQDCEGAG